MHKKIILGRLEILKLLVEFGADLTLCNKGIDIICALLDKCLLSIASS